VDIRSAQKRAWQNKVAKGFNTTDIPLECLLQGEMAEAFDAWRKGREDLGEELADVAIYLLSLAEMTGVDLQDEIESKMAKNAACSYQRLANGVRCRSGNVAHGDRVSRLAELASWAGRRARSRGSRTGEPGRGRRRRRCG
jgi:NTP pyrophosphatase (non-canonical NTP hydrolase)